MTRNDSLKIENLFRIKRAVFLQFLQTSPSVFYYCNEGASLCYKYFQGPGFPRSMLQIYAFSCSACHEGVDQVIYHALFLFLKKIIIYFFVFVRHSRRKDTEIDGFYYFSIWSKDLLKVVKSHNLLQ